MKTGSGCLPMGALGLLAAFVATIGWLVVHRISNEPVKPLETTSPGDTHGGASYLQASYPRITFNR